MRARARTAQARGKGVRLQPAPGLIKGTGSARRKMVWARELLLKMVAHDIAEGRHAAGSAGTAARNSNLFGKTVFIEDAAAGVKTEAAYAEDEHMLRESAALVGSADTKLDELCRKYTGVRIADGKGRAREEFVVVNVKVSPAPTEDGHDYYYADCCRLGEDGKTPAGAVGPVSGEILPSMRETFYIHHEDESFKHVPFDELVAAYSSDS